MEKKTTNAKEAKKPTNKEIINALNQNMGAGKPIKKTGKK